MPILYNDELFYKGNKLNISKYLFGAYGYYYFFFRQWIWRVLKDTEGPCQRIDGVCYELGSRIYVSGYGHRWNTGSMTSTILNNDDYMQTINGSVMASYRANAAGARDCRGYYINDLISPIRVSTESSNSGQYVSWSYFKNSVNVSNQNNGIGGGGCEFYLVGDNLLRLDNMNANAITLRVAL